MYITNTTFVVEPHAHAAWTDVMKNRFIPLLADNGYQVKEFCRVLSADNDGHYTYSLQVGLGDMERYGRFMDEMLGEWAAVAGPMFGDSVLWFNTLMKKVEL